MAKTGEPGVPQATQRRLSIGRRLFYTHLLVAVLVALSLGTYLHWAAEAELRSALNSRMMDNASLAAEAIQLADWSGIRSPSDTTRPEYAELQRRFSGITEHNQVISRLLLMRRQDQHLLAVADSSGANSGYAPGDTLPEALSARVTGTGAQSIAAVGSEFNAVAPIKGSDGSYLLALHVSADDIADKLANLRRNAAVSFIIAAALALAMSLWLAQSARRVLRRFSTRFREIAEGKLGQRLDLGGNDEFADLAVALDDMSARLELSQSEREGALTDLKTARDRLEGMVRDRSAELEKLNIMLRSEIEQRCQLEAALAEAAATDTMTRLLNRRGMLEALEQAAEQARRQKTSFIVAIGDVDHFKRVNDEYGHSVGDQVLIGISRRLKNALHHRDAAGRWGGEEFLLLWPGMNITEAENRANSLRESVAAGPIFPNGPQVSISIGVAEFTGLDTLDRCINRADKALYRAKLDGRNRVCVGV
jgi:diguanylate cyclase (GGDEF)-like protein